MGVRNEVHASMEVYTNAHISQPLESKSSNQHVTYFGQPEVRFGQVGEASSAGAEVAAAVVVAAAAVPDAAGGPATVVVAAAELLTAAAGISTAAAAE